MDKILQHFGYIKKESFRDLEKEPYTDQEILDMFIDTLGDLENAYTDENVEKSIFKLMNEVEGVQDYFRSVMRRDIKRYMGAPTTAEQILIRGAFNRTAFMKSRLTKKETKVKSLKYV